ncbi:17222_t:CDS:2 [Gigaspora rosea]|nr:17222_t:CDS:2 [Gigaspora rosea]
MANNKYRGNEAQKNERNKQEEQEYQTVVRGTKNEDKRYQTRKSDNENDMKYIKNSEKY